jgi:hypothetical protein
VTGRPEGPEAAIEVRRLVRGFGDVRAMHDLDAVEDGHEESRLRDRMGRRLAGAVGPEQTEDLAALQSKLTS